MRNNAERIGSNSERESPLKEDLEKLGAERREALREQHERAGERSRENLDETRQEALEKAQSIEKHERSPQTKHERSSGGQHDKPIGRIEREASFNATMEEIRTHMSPSSRTFSRAIHNKTVEKLSDSIGDTIARPNAILSGAVLAFILTLAVYLVAKNIGYSLSGFETIASFIIGWILGICYDFLKTMITGRKS